MQNKKNTIYITRNGLLEPLGQSQVFAYLRGLSENYRVTLITYEKHEDLLDELRVRRLRENCERLGINWLPQRFIATPKLIAPALSMMRMIWLLASQVIRQRACLIHARSYIPATVAMLVGRFTNVPFIFDMRALWPEELITANRLRRGSWLHKAIIFSERACLRRAGTVVSLTHAAAEYLLEQYPLDLNRQKVTVIPTCADLDRFVSSTQSPTRNVIGCLGTVLSGWFRIDWLSSFLLSGARRDPSLLFELTTRDDPEKVRAEIGYDSDIQSRLFVASCPSEKVHEVLQGQRASVMFYAGGEISELGRSPTRMAEILGCGLPVVANEGVGDVAEIIRKFRVGVLVSGISEIDMNTAWDELQELLDDPDLADRCRRAAESLFSLEAGTKAYFEIYRQILNKSEGDKVVIS